MTTVEIPNRSLFKAPEVCQIVGVQPYVLRSWEAEFPELGILRREGGPRVYRRADVERVLQIKRLVFVEGLTLAGARRRLGDEERPADAEGPPLEELLGRDARERLVQVRDGLREVLEMLSRHPRARDGEPASDLRPSLSPHGAARRVGRASGREPATSNSPGRSRKPVRRARR
jgi:DNA-binding transcriptional MerR regulator